MYKKLLQQAHQTVFSLDDIALICGLTDKQQIINLVHHHIRRGEMLRLAKGLYAINSNYSAWELGNKLRVPSYVTSGSILVKHGVIFQYFETIFLAADRSEQITLNGQKYIYRQLADSYLSNAAGIVTQDYITQASLERAILDRWYWGGVTDLDNPRPVNWTKVSQLNQSLYQSVTFAKAINTFMKG